MNKKLFLAMSRRRVSCPLTAQQLWDAVKIIRYKRQVPDIERISRYMNRTHNVSDDEVGRQINYCVRDGLLKVIKKIGSKGSKIGVEQEGYKLPDDKIEKDGHDWYCFECHSGGDVICCTSCHRVYHLSCMSKDDLPEDDVKNKFTCNVCKRCANKELTPSIKKSQLNRLLKYTATKMKERLPVALTDRQPPSNTSYLSERFAIQGQVKSPSIDVPSNFKWVLNDKDDWRVDYLIYRPIDLHIMESKADCGKYEHLEDFRADIQTIVHNVVIFHGVHSNMADMARLMLRDCNSDLQEILECWLCYKHSNDKTLRNWFIKPCKPPHELVYARQKGYPYWPAKVIKENEDSYDVRFFGGLHERAIVEKLYIRPISVNIHTLQVKRTSSWNRACEELKRYQKQLDKLREETDNFTKPFVDSSSDESDDESVIGSKENSSALASAAAVDEVDEYDDDGGDGDEEASSDPLPKRASIAENVDKRDETAADEKEPAVSLHRINHNAAKGSSVVAEKAYTKSGDTKTAVNKKCRTTSSKAVVNEDMDTERKIIRSRGRPKKTTPPSMSRSTSASTADKAESIASDVAPANDETNAKVTLPSTVHVRIQKTRGRPPKALSQAKKARVWPSSESVPIEETKTFTGASTASSNASETKKSTPKSPANPVDASAVKFENEIEDHNISSTSAAAKCLTSPKGNEEEIVSSSSSLQNQMKRSVKTQTKPLDTKPSKEWIEKIEEEFEQEKERLIAKLNKEHEQEIAHLRQTHSAILSETKRKQWCVNCESEAIYHCCWNTSYCSPDCQLAHWAADHKRHCRRKR